MASATQEQTPIKTPNFLRPGEFQRVQQELAHLQRALEDAKRPSSPVRRGDVQEAMKRVQKQLELAPPELSGEKKDRVRARIKYLEERIREGMPTDVEMRRNPDGAVDKNMRWQKRTKKMQLEWKNLQLALHGRDIPPDEASGLCSVERLRPTERSGELNMHNAQIQGKDFYDMSSTWNSEHPKAACYEELFCKDDPEKQALIDRVNQERSEREELQKQMDMLRAEIAAMQAQSKPAQQQSQNHNRR